MKSIAVAAYSFARSPELREALERAYPGIPISWNTAHQVLSENDLIEFLGEQTHAILGRETVDAQLLSQLPTLSVVAKYGVGLDSLDLPAMAKAGLKLGWKPGVNRRAVAELALTFMLTTVRGLQQAVPGLKIGNWQRPQGQQLSGKTIGIVGMGNVGRELVELLRPFRTPILAYDIRADEADYSEYFRANGIEAVDLETLLKRADLVSLHTPKNASTLQMLDARRLALLPPHAILINTARGGLVDEAATLAALDHGKLRAAAFDVFEEEPSSNTALIAHPHFIGTPHIGGGSEEAVRAMGWAAIEGLSTAADPLLFLRYQ